MQTESNEGMWNQIEAPVLERRRQLGILMNEANEALAHIRALRQRSAAKASGPDTLPTVEPDDYKGQPLQQALENYLRHKDRKGLRIPSDRGASDLYIGGVVMPDRGLGQKGRLQNFRMSLSMNKRLVVYDQNTKEFWLADTAKEPKPKPEYKLKKQKKKSPGSDDSGPLPLEI